MTPQRGEIWIVNFNSPISARTPPEGSPRSKWPTTGDEINKKRPAVVLSVSENWEYKLHIVVPLRRWKIRFQENGYFWIIHLPKDRSNHLKDDSSADTFQVKSVSVERFINRTGVVTAEQLKLIAGTIAYNIGYTT